MSQLWEPTGYTQGARARLSVWGCPDGIRSRLDIYDEALMVDTARALLADALDRLLEQRSDDWLQETASVMNVVAMREGEPVDGLEHAAPDHYPDLEVRQLVAHAQTVLER